MLMTITRPSPGKKRQRGLLQKLASSQYSPLHREDDNADLVSVVGGLNKVTNVTVLHGL